MRFIFRAALLCCVCFINRANAVHPTVYDAINVHLEYIEADKRIGVKDGADAALPFFCNSLHSIQVLNWAIASGVSLGCGLSHQPNVKANDKQKHNMLVSGENGTPGLYYMDTRLIAAPTVIEGVAEFYFQRDANSRFKIYEVPYGKSPFYDLIQVANANGGGFLRIILDLKNAGDDTICVWQPEHPCSKSFNPNAWRQKKSIASVSLQLFNDLFVIDPYNRHFQDRKGKLKFHKRFRKDTYWIGNRDFILQPWQVETIAALEDEAKRRRKLIACSMELRTANLKENPWARQAFCFLVDAAVLPGGEVFGSLARANGKYDVL